MIITYTVIVLYLVIIVLCTFCKNTIKSEEKLCNNWKDILHSNPTEINEIELKMSIEFKTGTKEK